MIGIGRYLDPNAFTRAPEAPNGTSPADQDFGNSGVGIVRGPGQHNLDMAVERLFPVKEMSSFRFRAEFFNLTNTPQFANPNTSLGYGDPLLPIRQRVLPSARSRRQRRTRASSSSRRSTSSDQPIVSAGCVYLPSPPGRCARAYLQLGASASMKESFLLFLFLHRLSAPAMPECCSGATCRCSAIARPTTTCPKTLSNPSLSLAAWVALVELDIRRTLDGQLVLNHDGILDRLTSGTGTVEQTASDELGLLDAGAWMGRRFTNMRIPSFDDALEVARKPGSNSLST